MNNNNIINNDTNTNTNTKSEIIANFYRYYKRNRPILRNPQIVYYNPSVDGLFCRCERPQKYLFASQTADVVLPYRERITQIITSSLGKGGRIHYGNFYLDKPLVTNYLGRFEGQPGGGGAPIRNRF